MNTQSEVIKYFNEEYNNDIFMPTDINKLIAKYTYCCPDKNLCSRCFFKKKYWGEQNITKGECELLNYPDSELEFLATPKFKRSRPMLRHSYPLITPRDTILKRFRLTNIENINYVEIEIGGMRMDKVYKNVIPTLQKIYNMEDDEIPFYLSKSGINSLDYHEIKINVEYSKICDNDILEFDIYKWKNVHQINNVIYQLQFTGKETLLLGDVLKKVNLDFNHPLLYLLSNYNVDMMELDLDGDIFKIPRLKTINNIGIYAIADYLDDFTNTINFSRIDEVSLNIYDSDLREVYVYGINTQVIRCMSGLAGLSFAS